MEELMTLAEVSRYLKLSEKTVQKMVKNGEIPCTKIANQWRFYKSMIEDWLASQMELTSRASISMLIEDENIFMPISRLISEDLILMDLKADTRDAALAEMADAAYAANIISDREQVLKKLLEREKLSTTGVGEGLALPHLRRPSARLVREPRIIIAVSKKGIEYDSFDGNPVYVLLMILSDNEAVHLRILSKISRLLRDRESAEHIRNFSEKEQFISFFIRAENDNYACR